MSNEDQVQSGVARCIEVFGRVDIVICVAGITQLETMLHETGPCTLEIWNRLYAINTVGVFNLARFGANAMKTNELNEDGERGNVILVSSLNADQG